MGKFQKVFLPKYPSLLGHSYFILFYFISFLENQFIKPLNFQRQPHTFYKVKIQAPISIFLRLVIFWVYARDMGGTMVNDVRALCMHSVKDDSGDYKTIFEALSK